MTQEDLFKVLVAHCKEYGFIFPSSEIYDGFAAVYDYGHMGVTGLKGKNRPVTGRLGGTMCVGNKSRSDRPEAANVNKS